MSLIPTLPELLARARADLRMGLPVVIDGYLAASVETLTSARLRDIRAFGAPQIVITDRRAQTLKARIYEAGLARLALPAEADMYWLRSVADPSAEWDIPMKGPFIAEREGAVPAHAAALALAKSAQLLPAMLMLPVETPDGLTRLPAKASLTELAAEAAMSHVTAARVPLSRAEKSRLHIYRPDTGGVDHYAIEIGEPDREGAVLVRLHSACYTGDVLGSLKCDCGPQLHAALDMMGQAGQGMLLYLNQEGRGIGLTNKMRAYSLQDQGFDTVEANHRLGFEDDERDFRLGAEMLRKMGISRVRLLTNNPRKVEMLSAQGIDVVERVPLVVPTNRFNEGYLATKAKKSGHLL